MVPTVNTVRSELESRRGEIVSRHNAGATGFRTCSDLTESVDTALKQLFAALPRGAADQIAILALGGYGRGELFPHSDVDIMVLCASGPENPPAQEAARSFLHSLWDAGINVGHSVRTVDEAMSLRGTTLDAWTSVLEHRTVCGAGRLAQELADRIAEHIRAGYDQWFVEGILADVRVRMERFGNSVKLLEPNVKKSAGGLRDLQAAFWLHRATDPACWFPLSAAVPAMQLFVEHLSGEAYLDADQTASAIQALEFLFRVRHEMHVRRAAQHDTLEYALQLDVADGLGYGRTDQMRSVEVFMREYYRHGRAVHRMTLHLMRSFQEEVERTGTESRVWREVRGRFRIGDDRLSVAPDVRRFETSAEVFEAFVLSAEMELEPDFRLRGAIERSKDLFASSASEDPALASMFRRIMRSSRVAATLYDMNELGILGAYIPEFEDLIAFFQHNVYHYYTADEHTLIALANAELLRIERGPLHEVYRMLGRKDTLLMAILLHDIAKPRGVADHEITGVEMARIILARLGMEEVLPDVGFLIRHHLSMEQIAFRRNLHDPATIRDFAGLFPRAELLDYLYVLTYADLSAVNRNVWTGWKAAMLQELYHRTADVLAQHLTGAEIDRLHESRRDKAVAQVVNALSADLSREAVQRHLQGIPGEAYVALFTEQEIGTHIRRALQSGPASALFAHTSGYTEVTIVGRDAPYALSKFCAVLSANDANIFDANIFTRDDGIVIDRFRVFDASSRQQLPERVCEKIEQDLVEVMNGALDIDHLFLEHHRKWKRRPRTPVNPSIRTDVQFEDTPRHTIIDVYASDAVGFLYRVTETISRLGLDIYFAKIATRVDGIVDTFYVLDRTGAPVTDPDRRQAIREEILATLRSTLELELG